MKFTELPEIVRFLLETFLPPIIKVSLLFIITLYLLGIRLQNFYLAIKGYFSLAIPNEASQKILSFYGISTIIPFLVIVLFFFAVYTLEKLIITITGLLPCHFSRTSPTALIYYSDIEELAQLFRINKNIKNLIDLDEFLEQKVDNASFKGKDNDSPYNKASLLRNQYLNKLSSLNYIKFLIYYLVFVVVFGFFTQYYVIAARFFILLLTIIILGLIFLSELIEVYRFYIQAKVEAGVFECNNLVDIIEIEENREEQFLQEINDNLDDKSGKRLEPFNFTFYYPVDDSIDNYISIFRAIGFRGIDYKKLYSKKLLEIENYKQELLELVVNNEDNH